jgi:hypothetical protein
MREILLFGSRFFAISSRFVVLWQSTAILRTDYAPWVRSKWPRAVYDFGGAQTTSARVPLLAKPRYRGLMYLNTFLMTPKARSTDARVRDSLRLRCFWRGVNSLPPYARLLTKALAWGGSW